MSEAAVLYETQDYVARVLKAYRRAASKRGAAAGTARREGS